MKIKKLITLGVGVLALWMPAKAEEMRADLTANPGYLDVDLILPMSQNAIRSEVYLQNYILKMIAKMTRRSEPEFSQMLSSIQLIRVLEYDFTEDANPESRASDLISHLRSNRWDTLVRRSDHGSHLNISVRSEQEDHINALAIVNWEDEKMSVVNVVGDIDLEMLTRLGEQFDIDALEDFEDSNPNG